MDENPLITIVMAIIALAVIFTVGPLIIGGLIVILATFAWVIIPGAILAWWIFGSVANEDE